GAPHIQVNLDNAIGAVAFRRSLLPESRAAFERGLKLCDRTPECRVAGLLNNLGAVAEDQGDYAAAEGYYRRALELREKALGPDHPDVAQVLLNMSDLAKEQGQHEQSLQLLLRVRTIYERAHGPESNSMASVLSRLGEEQTRAGKFDEART